MMLESRLAVAEAAATVQGSRGKEFAGQKVVKQRVKYNNNEPLGHGSVQGSPLPGRVRTDHPRSARAWAEH